MASKKINMDNIKQKIRSYAQKVVSQATRDIRDELTQEAFDSIVFFYTSYTPKYYNRHYYNFLENSFRKYYSNAHGTIYRGGVELTPDLMDDIYQRHDNQSSLDEVFESVYAGFHGPASMIGQGYASIGETPFKFSRVPDRMWPSPMERILKKRDYIEKHIDDYIKSAKKKVDNNKV